MAQHKQRTIGALSCLLISFLPAVAQGQIGAVCSDDVEVDVDLGRVVVPILINGWSGPMSAFGVDVHYDDTFLTFDQVSRSSFTATWDFFDANLLSPGRLRVGGFTMPDETPADRDILVYVEFDIAAEAVGTAEVSVRDFVDDLNGLPECAGLVTFNPPISIEPQSWGRVKVSYR